MDGNPNYVDYNVVAEANFHNDEGATVFIRLAGWPTNGNPDCRFGPRAWMKREHFEDLYRQMTEYRNSHPISNVEKYTCFRNSTGRFTSNPMGVSGRVHSVECARDSRGRFVKV